MAKVRFRRYKSFSGPVIYGAPKATAFEKETMKDFFKQPHLFRAFWLTSMVESAGRIGAIMMADGTGCTAGLHQCVAIYPRNMSRQGSLFKLLAWMNKSVDLSSSALGKLFDDHGWLVNEHGQLVDKNSLHIISPSIIREAFTPNQGRVEFGGSHWRTATRWALRFHDYFSNKEGIDPQIFYALNEMNKFTKEVKQRRLLHHTIFQRIYKEYAGYDFLPQTLDLAMAVWWSYKVNAPDVALTKLNLALMQYDIVRAPKKFSRALIRHLITAKYGAWATNRYRRTWKYARKMWEEDLFEGTYAIFPEPK